MIDEPGLLSALSRALSDQGPALGTDELVVVRRDTVRRRSKILFVGTRADPARSRWVVKAPDPTATQAGLDSPLPAAAQQAALVRLHEHLSARGGPLRAPRPLVLPESTGSVAMEFVEGPVLSQWVGGALRGAGRRRLLDGLATAGRGLATIHALEPGSARPEDRAGLEERLLSEGRAFLEAGGLPVRADWFRAGPRDPEPVTVAEVLLHGDWAPENVLFGPDGVYALDPSLDRRGPAEEDVARFLAMLFESPVFVVTAGIPALRRLRQEAGAAFLRAYYGDGGPPAHLRWHVVRMVCGRYAMRHRYLAPGGPVEDAGGRLLGVRRRLVRRHFSAVLDEVSDPAWPGPAVNRG